MRFGEFLIKSNQVSESEVLEALDLQKKHQRKKIGRILVELEEISQESLNLSLQRYFRDNQSSSLLEARKQSSTTGSPDGRLISERFGWIIWFEDQGRIEFLSTKFDDKDLEEAEKRIQKEITIRIVSKELFDSVSGPFRQRSREKSRASFLNEVDHPDKLEERLPYTSLFKECIAQAKEKGSKRYSYRTREVRSENLFSYSRRKGSLEESWKRAQKRLYIKGEIDRWYGSSYNWKTSRFANFFR